MLESQSVISLKLSILQTDSLYKYLLNWELKNGQLF